MKLCSVLLPISLSVALGSWGCGQAQAPAPPHEPGHAPELPARAELEHPSASAAPKPAPSRAPAAASNHPPGVAASAVERTTLEVNGEHYSLHLPKGAAAPHPTVLVFHSAMGRTDSVLGWCDRLAEAGFAAVALDFYDGAVATNQQDALQLRDAANSRSNENMQSVEQVYAALRTDPRLRAERRYLLGWSYGGAWATFAAGSLPDVDGVVAYYGQAYTENSALSQGMGARVLLVGARRDPKPSPEKLETALRILTDAGITARLRLFDADHGFAEHAHDNYDPAAAEQAWQAVLAFLELH